MAKNQLRAAEWQFATGQQQRTEFNLVPSGEFPVDLTPVVRVARFKWF
jgi:hypothetical protein